MNSSFPIPSSLQDLERSPYDLLPYPLNFEDDDEATRADSFDKLVLVIERSNRSLSSGGMALFETPDGEEDFNEWNDEERIQALYTLVRKSPSLALSTRKRTITALCKALNCLSSILYTSANESQTGGDELNPDQHNTTSKGNVVSQAFRDAFACHIYMVYSITFLLESEAKVEKSLGKQVGPQSTPGRRKATRKEKERKAEIEQVQALREECATTMMVATQSMAQNKSNLWRRGVPDEDVLTLPCRIAYQMLESATGVIARKLSSADTAMKIIAISLDSHDSLLNTVVAALMDLLHSFEHIAPLVVEICCLVCESPCNKLAVELLREVGRLDTNSTGVDASSKASGIRNVVPFINELAEKRPSIVLENVTILLPHLNSEPYSLRSAIITAIGHILVRCIENEEDEGSQDIYSSNEEGQFEEQRENTRKQMKMRDKLFDILTQRIYDVSSYTRVVVLKTWSNLIVKQSLPVKRLVPITSLAIDRLQDKTVMVRRSAMQTLTVLLENNPFTDSLNPENYFGKFKEVKEYILTNLPVHLREATDSALEELDRNEGNYFEQREDIQNAAVQAIIIELESLDDDDKDNQQSQLLAKVRAYQFLQSAIEFIKIFESAHIAFDSMLLSSNNSDVTEALRFFVRARHFQLPCAITGIKQALSLMWSNEKNIQAEVLSAFVEVFIAIPATNGERLLPSNKIVHNFLVLVNKATVSEMASIEEAICRLVKDEVIPADVFLILWSIAAKANGKARSAAMSILSMGASCDPSIVDSASRLRHLLEAGLGEYTEEQRDWATAKSAACALQRVSKNKPDPSSAKAIVLELILERLRAVIQGDWCNDSDLMDTQAWFGAAEQGINALFVICVSPEQVCKDIIQALEAATFGFSRGTPNDSCHSLRLSRFFFVISHIALKLLVYTESISGAVRRGNAARTLSKQEEADKAKKDKEYMQGEESETDDAIENELGVSQAAEADTENKVAEITEKEILGRGMIGIFAPLLVRILANEDGLFSSEALMQSSTLALCKFMCISRSFCEKHLPLLFTVLSNAPIKDVSLRANTVIALGDLAFRFPNEVEPYTPRLYAFLRDKSTRVRRHTLMVLTHLILNDMVKVKGQVCEIALCLIDKEIRIRDMARLLFNELSKRSNNPIYNLLPDIVSRLSVMSMKKENFRSIMSFLLSFIKKERQNEMLADKLCHRFPKCTTISQKADITFCLAQLKINERSIRLLNDLFKLYRDALFDEDVMKSFSAIVSKAKKIGKPELKEYVEEWEAKLNEYSRKMLENQIVGNKAKRVHGKSRSKHNRVSLNDAQESQFDGEASFTEYSNISDNDKENTDPM